MELKEFKEQLEIMSRWHSTNLKDNIHYNYSNEDFINGLAIIQEMLPSFIYHASRGRLDFGNSLKVVKSITLDIVNLLKYNYAINLNVENLAFVGEYIPVDKFDISIKDIHSLNGRI